MRSLRFLSFALAIVVAANEVEAAEKGAAVSADLAGFFRRLDELGRAKVKDAKFVELRLGRKWSVMGWLVKEDEKSVTVLLDELLPRTYQKKSATARRSQTGRPLVESVRDADFDKFCKDLSAADKPLGPGDELMREVYSPTRPHRLLAAHAAWKRGHPDVCEAILAADPTYAEGFKGFEAAVLEDLAWRHFLTAVTLLADGDRAEVLPYLQLVPQLSPKGDYADDAKDLLTHLKRLVDEEKKPKKPVAESKLSDAERADLYVRQLVDFHTEQHSQPGEPDVYLEAYGPPEKAPPTKKLKDLGMKAVPALIKGLEDHTPTRSVSYWRDFHRSRYVWRVSDFCWYILRDITKKDFGRRDERREAIEEVKKWYAANKDATPDERMLAMFSSRAPEDWLTAGKYFLKTKDKRAVKPLLEGIGKADRFRKGEFCELVAQFGDPAAKKVLKETLEPTNEHSDRLHAAIGLWALGDEAGIPVVIEYVKAEDQPYGQWHEPVWLLMKTKKKEAMDALRVVVTGPNVERATEVIEQMTLAISGNLWSKRREPAGCVEVAPIFMAAMERADKIGTAGDGRTWRIKDMAAWAFALLREGSDEPGGWHVEIDPKVFNAEEPDEAKRDKHIEELKKWYEKNKGKLGWDSKKNRLSVKK